MKAGIKHGPRRMLMSECPQEIIDAFLELDRLNVNVREMAETLNARGLRSPCYDKVWNTETAREYLQRIRFWQKYK